MEPNAQSSATDATTEHANTDIAYTVNHALSCATTDMLIAPTVSALFGVNIGCTDPSHQHTHGHEHHHHHEYHTHAPAPPHSKLNWKLYRSEALHYLKGEIIGDVLAVPLTIGVQRLFPSLMDRIRSLLEPIAAPFFRRGADHAANRWGHAHGFTSDAPEIVDRAEAMYRSEIEHLPQAVMWNLFAFPIGVIAQKRGGHSASYASIIRNKTIGSVVSNVILLGSRAIAPDVAEKWDAMNSTHFVTPVSNFVGKLFGKYIPAGQADITR